MLSRIAKVSLVRAFSSTVPVVGSSDATTIAEKSHSSETSLSSALAKDLAEMPDVVETERKHLNYYLNELKEELNDQLGINFESAKDGKTLILESIHDGSNSYKLGEVLLAVSGVSLWKLLLGFPSYLSLVGVLGVGAVGGVWSYSNYLRRRAPRITRIFRNNDGSLDVHYLKPGLFFAGAPANFNIQASSYSLVSFGSSFDNFLRKSNRTAWVNIDGKLYWYNDNPQTLRVNNHHLL